MEPWKSSRRALFCGILALGLIGCVVPSLGPLFEGEDCVQEPGLVGKWEKMDGENRSLETLEIVAADNGGYRFVNVDKEGKKATLLAQFGKIDGQEYLCAAFDPESLPNTSVWFVALPPHFLIFKVEQLQPELRLIALSYDACAKLLAEKPQVVAHVKMKLPKKEGEEPAKDESIYFLTAGPAGLQKFIRENADPAGLFDTGAKLVFVRPEEAARRDAVAKAAQAAQAEAAAAAREAERVKKYDLDGDGKLSPEEQKRAEKVDQEAQKNAANSILAPPLE